MHRLHVLWIIDKLSMDGVHPSCIAQNLAAAVPFFDPADVRISVCDLRAREPAAAVLEAAGIPVYFIGRGKYSPFILTSLLALIRRENVRILHCHGYNAANFGRLAGRLRGLPVIVHEHGTPHMPVHQFIADRLLRHWTTVAVAVSEAVREFMMRARSVPRRLTRTIYNGIVLDTFRSVTPQQRTACREALGIPPERRVIGYVGRLDAVKGVSYLIEAMPAVLRAAPDAMLVLVGEGAQRDALQARARELGIVEQVRFAGFAREVAPFFSVFDLAVMPSVSEGFPYVAIETMAGGVPLLATRVGGLPELIEHDRTGWLVPPCDSRALAEGLVRLLGDPALCRRLAAAAAARSEVFSMASYVRRLKALYAELAAVAACVLIKAEYVEVTAFACGL